MTKNVGKKMYDTNNKNYFFFIFYYFFYSDEIGC